MRKNNLPSLQEPFLHTLKKEKQQVFIFLTNGVKLHGRIEAFDQYVIILKNDIGQMVYKHAISTIVPSKLVKISMNDGNHDYMLEGN